MTFTKHALAQQPLLRNSYNAFHGDPKKIFGDQNYLLSIIIGNKDINVPSRSPHTTFVVNRFTTLHQQMYKLVLWTAKKKSQLRGLEL